MAQRRHSMVRLRKALGIAAVLVGMAITDISKLAALIPYFQRPEVVYFTEDFTTYPITYQENKPVLADIQGRMLLDGPIKMLDVVVRNEGERGASTVCVRIPWFANDGYLGGLMRKSEDPSNAYMLGPETERCFQELMPGDEVRFYLYLRSVNSKLADRVDVFDGEGRRATRYRYALIGGYEVIISLGRCLTYLFGFILLLLLARRSWMTKPEQPPLSAEEQRPVDAHSSPPTSSPGSTQQQDEEAQYHPPNDRTAGRR